MPNCAQRIEAAAEKLGLTGLTVKLSGTEVRCRMSGPTSDVAKPQKWATSWSKNP